jgi:transposase-like protein
MSLRTISDAFLAARSAEGDEAAFAELAYRYRRLVDHMSAGPPAGVDLDDLRPVALLGLLDTCYRYDPAKGAFAALAKRNVRQQVIRARVHARTVKHRLLSEAARDGDDPKRWLAERLPAPAGTDPARRVELYDELREYAERTRKVDRRRRYSDEQIARALDLIAEGKTPKEAAFAVGAPRARVVTWAKRAGQRGPTLRRRFTATEIDQARALVRRGASLREAAAAVGTTGPTVLRWMRAA